MDSRTFQCRSSLADHRVTRYDSRMDWQVSRNGHLTLENRKVRAALGRAGVTKASDKCEGDGATPLGTYAVRRVLYRADRLSRPQTELPCRPLQANDGWCDAPEDPAYNRAVRRPYPASHEAMWREDGLYDIILVLGHNDDPPIAGAGSAIFLHCKRDDYKPTEGCIALDPDDVRALLKALQPGDTLTIA